MRTNEIGNLKKERKKIFIRKQRTKTISIEWEKKKWEIKKEIVHFGEVKRKKSSFRNFHLVLFTFERFMNASLIKCLKHLESKCEHIQPFIHLYFFSIMFKDKMKNTWFLPSHRCLSSIEMNEWRVDYRSNWIRI